MAYNLRKVYRVNALFYEEKDSILVLGWYVGSEQTAAYQINRGTIKPEPN